MVDVFLVVIAVVMSVVVLGSSVIFVNHFAHPDDKADGTWLPRAICIAGVFLAICSLLVMPYDVANTRVESATNDSLSINVLWEIIYIAMAVMLGFVIPFAYFYYESDISAADAAERGCCSGQTCQGLKFAIIFCFCFTALLVTLSFVLAKVYVPGVRIAQSATWVVGQDETLPNYMAEPIVTTNGPCVTTTSGENGCVFNDFTWEMPMSFTVFVIAFLSFFGWWFFMVFAGVGMVALPLDQVNKYRTRPKPMKRRDFIARKIDLGRRATKLREIGQALLELNDEKLETRKAARKQAQRVSQFEKAYHLLKMDMDILMQIRDMCNQNPLIPVGYLVSGILGGFISFFWIIHIILFVLPDPPIHDFLNDFFIGLETGIPNFPFFGIIAYAFFMYYLLWAVIVGCYRLGLRCLLINLYPMEVNGTHINGLLANIWVIILCSVPAVQFSVTCFPVYAKDTYVDVIFGSQVQYMQAISWFWTNDFFIYILLGFNVLTLVYLCFYPTVDSDRERIQADITALHTEREAKARE